MAEKRSQRQSLLLKLLLSLQRSLPQRQLQKPQQSRPLSQQLRLHLRKLQRSLLLRLPPRQRRKPPQSQLQSQQPRRPHLRKLRLSQQLRGQASLRRSHRFCVFTTFDQHLVPRRTRLVRVVVKDRRVRPRVAELRELVLAPQPVLALKVVA